MEIIMFYEKHWFFKHDIKKKKIYQKIQVGSSKLNVIIILVDDDVMYWRTTKEIIKTINLDLRGRQIQYKYHIHLTRHFVLY